MSPNHFLISLVRFSVPHSRILLSLYYSLSEREQVAHPHKTLGKIAVLCLLVFKFLDNKQQHRRFWAEFSEYNLHLIYLCMYFYLLIFFPRHLNLATYAKDLLDIFMLYFYSALCSGSKNKCLVFSTFPTTEILLLATTKNASVLFFYSSNIFTQ